MRTIYIYSCMRAVTRMKAFIRHAGADYRFLSEGGKIFQAARKARNIFLAPPVRVLPPSVWGQSYNRGDKYFLPSFIMIWLSVLFWHFCIFLKQ